MAVVFKTNDSKKLADALKRDIAAGKIATWEIDKDGDLRHTPGDWRSKAWVKLYENTDNLTLGIQVFDSVKDKREIFGVVSGRVVEPFISHLYALFDTCSVGKNPTTVDYPSTL